MMKTLLALAVVLAAATLLPASNVQALTCCDPKTSICVTIWDPYCDLQLCWPSPPTDVVLNYPAPYQLDCAAVEHSFTVAQGVVTIAAGSLTIQ